MPFETPVMLTNLIVWYYHWSNDTFLKASIIEKKANYGTIHILPSIRLGKLTLANQDGCKFAFVDIFLVVMMTQVKRSDCLSDCQCLLMSSSGNHECLCFTSHGRSATFLPWPKRHVWFDNLALCLCLLVRLPAAVCSCWTPHKEQVFLKSTVYCSSYTAGLRGV